MRYVALCLSVLGTMIFAALGAWSSGFLMPGVLCAALAAIVLCDLMQERHSLRRNYPILANIGFGLETIRPEIRQYFLDSDLDGTLFNRSKRAVVYQRAKGALD